MDKWYNVHTDNWYSSLSLFYYLQERKTSAAGTVHTNRKHMPTDQQAKGRGSVDFRSTNSGMLALQRMDKTPVTMLSTVHTREMVFLPPNRQRLQRSKPKVVVEYNHGVKGVGLSDQQAQPNRATRKPMKWHRKIVFSLPGHGCGQLPGCAQSPWRKYGTRHLQIRACARLAAGGRTPRKKEPSAPATPAALVRADAAALQDHMPEDTSFRRWRRCAFCWRTKGKRKQKRIMCKICEVSPPLLFPLLQGASQHLRCSLGNVRLVYVHHFVCMCIYSYPFKKKIFFSRENTPLPSQVNCHTQVVIRSLYNNIS